MEAFMHDQQSHATWKCEYHIVIVPKYRKKALYGPIRRRAGEIIRELAKRKGVEVIEGNACPDHIHLVLSIPPRASVAQTMGFIKGKAAIRLHIEFGKKGKSRLIQLAVVFPLADNISNFIPSFLGFFVNFFIITFAQKVALRYALRVQKWHKKVLNYVPYLLATLLIIGVVSQSFDLLPEERLGLLAFPVILTLICYLDAKQ